VYKRQDVHIPQWVPLRRDFARVCDLVFASNLETFFLKSSYRYFLGVRDRVTLNAVLKLLQNHPTLSDIDLDIEVHVTYLPEVIDALSKNTTLRAFYFKPMCSMDEYGVDDNVDAEQTVTHPSQISPADSDVEDNQGDPSNPDSGPSLDPDEVAAELSEWAATEEEPSDSESADEPELSESTSEYNRLVVQAVEASLARTKAFNTTSILSACMSLNHLRQMSRHQDLWDVNLAKAILTQIPEYYYTPTRYSQDDVGTGCILSSI
jgi:hypothetical protein